MKLLSEREKEIAVLVARGLRNREIARALRISRRTVENHLAQIYAKLDLHSRSQLTIYVLSQPDSPDLEPDSE